MDSEERTETMHNLDMKYQQAIHECDLVVRTEEARRLKVRSMVLRDETSGAKDQLAQKDLRVKELVEQIEDVRSQLDSAHEKSRRQDNLMQSQAREITNLKEELSAFNAVSQDSAKVLSEKLALSREVAVLKPELEHLRSQLAHQKDVLAEKLALERQLNTLEVELANEKRAAEKAAQKQDGDNEVEEELRKQVRELEKELAKGKRLAERNNKAEAELQGLREKLATVEESLATEKRRADQLAKAKSSTTSDMQEEQASAEELTQLREELAEAVAKLAEQAKVQEKLRRESEQARIDAEERQQAAFDKVDRLRSKLRDAQEELKKCRAELEKVQERAVKVPTVATTTVPLKGAGAKANAKKKRPAEEMSMDDKVLLTPGMDDRPKRPLKKRGFDLSMVGGKSEFSITPFLNKTHNPDGSPKPAGEEATPTPAVQFRGAEETAPVEPAPEEPAPEATAAVESSAVKPASAIKLVEKRPRGRPRTKPLNDASPSKKNLTARNRKAPRVESTLDKVTEEAEEGDSSTNQDQENRPANNADAEPAVKSTTDAAIELPEKVEPKKKKRKLLGANPSTLFDEAEDEGEKVKPTATAAPAGKRPPIAKAGGAKAMGKGPSAARFGAGVKNAFGGASFSPLKKERRGVAASFLA